MKKNYYRKRQKKKKQLSETRCIICFEKLKFHTIFENCTHTNTCWKCTLINRNLGNNKSCCYCKEESDRVILSHTDKKQFKDYDLSSLNYDEQFKVYYTIGEIRTNCIDLRAFKCRVCASLDPPKNVRFDDMKELEEHLFVRHNKRFCEFCLQSRKAFLKDQIILDVDTYKEHLIYGSKVDDTDGCKEDLNGLGYISGHPICLFCNKRFFSDDELFRHLRNESEHEQCHLCKQKGIKFEFYENYKTLEKHFYEKHFVCTHPDCGGEGEGKYLSVFQTQFELKCHIKKVHDKKKKIKLDLTDLQVMGQQETSVNSDRVDQSMLDATVIRFVGRDDLKGRLAKPTQKEINDVFKKKRGDDDEEEEEKKKKKNKFSRQKHGKFKFPKPFLEKVNNMLSYDNYQHFENFTNDFLFNSRKAIMFYQDIDRLFKRVDKEKIFPYIIRWLPDEKHKIALDVARKTYESKEFKTATKTAEKRKNSEKIKKNSKVHSPKYEIGPDISQKHVNKQQTKNTKNKKKKKSERTEWDERTTTEVNNFPSLPPSMPRSKSSGNVDSLPKKKNKYKKNYPGLGGNSNNNNDIFGNKNKNNSNEKKNKKQKSVSFLPGLNVTYKKKKRKKR